MPVPRIEYNVVGTCAGKFTTYSKDNAHELAFNLILAEENQDVYIKRTVPHEIAHYVCWLRAGKQYERSASGNRISHGAKWKAVMSELGASDAARCHSYDVSSVSTRKYKMYEYQCERCGKSMELTSIKHNRIISGKQNYVCREDRGALQLVREL